MGIADVLWDVVKTGARPFAARRAAERDLRAAAGACRSRLVSLDAATRTPAEVREKLIADEKWNLGPELDRYRTLIDTHPKLGAGHTSVEEAIRVTVLIAADLEQIPALLERLDRVLAGGRPGG